MQGPDDDNFRKLAAAATDSEGEVHCVLVHCRNEVRKQRIVDESRVQMRKLTDPSTVDTSHLHHDLLSPHPDFADSTLIIDTSDISPDEAAIRVIEHFGLRGIGERDEI